MKKLEFLIGTWKADDKYESSRLMPHGGSGSGIYRTVLGPAGFSVVTDYHYKGPQGHASGHQVLTWDAKKGQYVGCIVTSSSPGCILLTGNWDREQLILSGEFETQGLHVRFREVFSDVSSTAMLLRQYNSVEGDSEQLFGTTRFTKIRD